MDGSTRGVTNPILDDPVVVRDVNLADASVETRTVQLVSDHSHMVTIPAYACKRHNIQKGDELAIKAIDEGLIVVPIKTAQPTETEVRSIVQRHDRIEEVR